MGLSSKASKSRIGLWIIGAGAVLVVLLIIFIITQARTPVNVESYDQIPAEWINGTELGDPDAPVVLVAYEDFLCPHCGEFTRAAKDNLVADFVVPGQVKFVYRFFPLQIFAPNSFAAARAGQCISVLSDSFWQYHDGLFFGQRGADRYTSDSLTRMATDLGIRADDFVECLASTSTQQAIEQSIQEGMDAGVTATPTLLINGVKFEGNVTNYDELKTALNAALQ